MFADGHKEIKGPQFEYFGSLSYIDITRFNDYKENFIADSPDGSLILANGDKGKMLVHVLISVNYKKNVLLI